MEIKAKDLPIGVTKAAVICHSIEHSIACTYNIAKRVSPPATIEIKNIGTGITHWVEGKNNTVSIFGILIKMPTERCHSNIITVICHHHTAEAIVSGGVIFVVKELLVIISDSIEFKNHAAIRIAAISSNSVHNARFEIRQANIRLRTCGTIKVMKHLVACAIKIDFINDSEIICATGIGHSE